MKKFNVRFVVGDWSDDGHNYSKEYCYSSNYPVNEIQEAYKRSEKKTKITFDKNRQTNTITEVIFDDYGVCSLSEIQIEKLQSFGLVVKKGRYTKLYFLSLLFAFIKLSLPDLKLEALDLDKNYVKKLGTSKEYPVFNGWWDKNLNMSMGYGLWTFPRVKNEKVKAGELFCVKSFNDNKNYYLITSVDEDGWVHFLKSDNPEFNGKVRGDFTDEFPLTRFKHIGRVENWKKIRDNNPIF